MTADAKIRTCVRCACTVSLRSRTQACRRSSWASSWRSSGCPGLSSTCPRGTGWTSAPSAPAATAVGGISIDVQHGLELLDRSDTIVVPGWPVADPVPLQLLQASGPLRRGARVVSICSGAFVLAAAGLLDGRRAATHWRYADSWPAPTPLCASTRRALRRRRPDPHLGRSAAGIDLCLHLVRKDHGAVIANQVARRLVTPPHRDGGQAQYVERPSPVTTTAAFTM